MKRNIYLLAVCLCLFFSSGCASTKQNTFDINQLKSQMANVETVLARQNLLIQQNKTEIDSLYDRNDQLARTVTTTRDTQSYAPSSASSMGLVSVASSSDLFSDKLQPQPSVTQVQTSLKNAGFYIGKIDGKAGPMTKEAVVSFQKANGLNGDGVVGKQTWARLKEFL